MDFLNLREGGMVFYQVFLLSPLQCTITAKLFKRLCEFEEIYKQLCAFAETEIARQICKKGDCE
jgi:hypothetical protein